MKKTSYNRFMRLIGITLIMFFFLLYGCVFYSYIYDLCQIYYIRYERNLAVGVGMMCIGYYLAFCIIFNYVMGIFVHPGRNDFRSAFTLSFQLSGIDDSDEEEDEPNNFKKSTSNRNRICKKCNYYKPLRAHHCSACNECVYKMDHHCPWLDNCIGYENHRYFLSFILYLFISMVYIACLFYYIELHLQQFKEAKTVHTALYAPTKLLSLILSAILFVFNIWNWHLAFKGYTAIEFWGQKDKSRNAKEYSFAFPTVRENLYHIFGTHSYFKMMIPSTRPLPHDGTQWVLQQANKNSNDIENKKDYMNDQNKLYNDEEEETLNSQSQNENKEQEYNQDIEGAL